jgi:hypothetical protein
MGWASGMQAGTNMAKQWIDTYNQANTQRGLRKLGPQASVVSGNTFEVGGATGLVADGEMGVDANGNRVDVQKAYANADQSIQEFNKEAAPDRQVATTGLAKIGGKGYATRAGSYDTGVHTDAKLAQQGVDRYNTGLKRAQADVYRQFGNDAMGMSLDNNAAEGERYARTEARQLDRDKQADKQADATHTLAQTRLDADLEVSKQQRELNQIKIAEENAKAQEAEVMRKTNQALADYETQNKRRPTLEEAGRIASGLGASPDQLYKMGAMFLGIKEQDAKAFKLGVEEAVRGKTYAELIALHKTDKRFDDGRHFTEQRLKGGGIALDLMDEASGKIVSSSTFANEAEATQFLYQAASDPKNILTWQMALDAQKLAMKKDEADISKSNAAVLASNAAASASNAEITHLKKYGVKPGSSTGAAYKVEMGEVVQAFGTPALDPEGKPITDMLTGKQVVNRNVGEENKFFTWMRQNGITDTNQGLAIYKAETGKSTSGGQKSGYQAYLAAFNKAKEAGNKKAMEELTALARQRGYAK